MVKRYKQDPIAGILEFAGFTSEDPEFMGWMAEHKSRNGGTLRVSKGATGVRVMFSKDADMAFWQTRFEKLSKERQRAAR